jgi:hypothetical protein
MKVFLDDLRDGLDGFVVVRSGEELISLISSGVVEFISFDHDLGMGISGYDVACFIERRAVLGHVVPGWCIHSANIVGRRNISMAMVNAERLYLEAKGE